MLTTKDKDESGKKWDSKTRPASLCRLALRNVEFFRDVKPIFDRSLRRLPYAEWRSRPGSWCLTITALFRARIRQPRFRPSPRPGTYIRPAADASGKYGHKPVNRHGGTDLSALALRSPDAVAPQPAHLEGVRKRLDGWKQRHFPHEAIPGDPSRCSRTASGGGHAAKTAIALRSLTPAA